MTNHEHRWTMRDGLGHCPDCRVTAVGVVSTPEEVNAARLILFGKLTAPTQQADSEVSP